MALKRTEQKQSTEENPLEISVQEPYSLLPSHVLSNLFEDACLKGRHWASYFAA